MLKLNLWCSVIFLVTVLGCSAEKLIIDTDAGPDDALAILLQLRAETLNISRYEVVAITCTFGNTYVENVEINVLKTLTIAKRSEIQVFSGANKPLVGNFTNEEYFGKDGFGDVEFNQEIVGKINKTLTAPMALIELSKKYKDDLAILTLGPVTNVATAASLDPEFISRVKKIVAMGGSVSVKSYVDFNFGSDPEAAFTLFNSTSSAQLTLVSREPIKNTNISKNWRIDDLGRYEDSPYVKFMNAIEKLGLDKVEMYAPSDAITAAVMIMPEMVGATVEANVRPVIDGADRGLVSVDYTPQEHGGRPFNTKIVQSVDAGIFKNLLVDFLSCKNDSC